MEYRKLVIRGISYSQTQSGAYALLLEDVETTMKLPIVIGSFEAQSISLGLEKDIKISRPLTHDLFSSFIRNTHFTPISVFIYKIVEGVFFSRLNFINKETGEDFSLDARTSDAVAMAVRFDIPIYTTLQVIEEAGILLDIDNNMEQEQQRDTENINTLEELYSDLDHLSLEDLESLLETAVSNEDFDMALEVQEAIKKRKKI